MSKRSQEHAREFYGTDSTGMIAPAFVGPDIAPQADATGGAIAPLDVSGNFDVGNGVNPVYSAVLPDGLVIDPTTGIITGTPTTISKTAARVYLNTTNGVATSNGFSWTST